MRGQAKVVAIPLIALGILFAGIIFNFAIKRIDDGSISPEVRTEFLKFQRQFGKSYGTPNEGDYRLRVFNKNYKEIEEVNARATTFEFGVNQFSDLTKEEFTAKYTGFKPTPQERRQYVNISQSSNGGPIDWRTRGAVGPVKNQARCGSCWAFSTTGALEAAYFLKHGKLISLSEQQLVDCSGAYGNLACQGGWMDWAMNYVKDKGIETDGAYSYRGVQQMCKADVTKNVDLKLTGVEFVKESEDALEQAVQNMPISIAFNASPIMSYRSGVFDGTCDPEVLSHAVLLVGWGQENGTEYWIVKNSWGAAWGEQGYIRFKKAHTGPGICGLARHAVYPDY